MELGFFEPDFLDFLDFLADLNAAFESSSLGKADSTSLSVSSSRSSSSALSASLIVGGALFRESGLDVHRLLPSAAVMGLPNRLGATLTDYGATFVVWSPNAARVAVETGGRVVDLQPGPRGYHHGDVEGVRGGDTYWLQLDGQRRPDPVSRSQPQGIEGPSAVLDVRFDWTDGAFAPPPLARWSIYELHVGTFTSAGTFAAAIDELDRLVELGVDAVEVMPINQFVGTRGWGYDGVFCYAAQDSYGGPEGFAAFVDACHARGLAVVLDVVYNHLGPEGNVLSDFGPYFASDRDTPWGPALDFTSGAVRRYFIDNALMWLEEFHVDALRLDAVQAIIDPSPVPFLAELSRRVAAIDGRRRYLMPESDANDPKLLRSRELGGIGLDSVWADDFHHAVHRLLTGEDFGYYADYPERRHLADAIAGGFSYTGQPSVYRKRIVGAPADDLPPSAFTVCVQNHDQVGNRADGARLSTLVSPAAQRLAIALLLTTPHVPLLFMGQEYGETRPFHFFVDYQQAALRERVRVARRRELAEFGYEGTPPDPELLETYDACRIDPSVATASPHRERLALHRRLLSLRREYADTVVGCAPRCVLLDEERVVQVHFGTEGGLMLVASLEPDARTPQLELDGSWRVVLESGEPALGGEGTFLPPMVDAGVSVRWPEYGFALLRRG